MGGIEKVLFSPHGGIDEEIVRWIGRGMREVKVMAYTFTSMLICQALIAALARGMNVVFVGDYGGMKGRGCLIDTLNRGGVSCWVDRHHQIMHNKVILIDDNLVITGSYNFTNAAERSNAENCIFIEDAEVASTYQEDWSLHQTHSLVYGILRAQIMEAQAKAESMVGIDFLDAIAGDNPVDPMIMEWWQV